MSTMCAVALSLRGRVLHLFFFFLNIIYLLLLEYSCFTMVVFISRIAPPGLMLSVTVLKFFKP